MAVDVMVAAGWNMSYTAMAGEPESRNLLEELDPSA